MEKTKHSPLPSLRRELQVSASFIRAFGFRAFSRRLVNVICVRPFRRYVMGSYSQDCEDLVIDRLLGGRKQGFYVDIGANDPMRSNNTMRFYRKGWTGINIEPDLHCFRRIRAKRPRDITLNVGIAQEGGESTFYSFAPATRSTFSEATAERLAAKGLVMVRTSRIEMQPLREVLERYCLDRRIDFMSIDTEGYDEQVLLSNDWKRYRPAIICIESRGSGVLQRILSGHGYVKAACTADNEIYRLEAM